jgi:hypothetical protein
MILETNRLRLREWRAGEETVLKTFLGSDEVMYAYEGGFTDQKNHGLAILEPRFIS